MPKSYFLTLEVESDEPVTLADLAIGNPKLDIYSGGEEFQLDDRVTLAEQPMHFASDQMPYYLYRLISSDQSSAQVFPSKAALVAAMHGKVDEAANGTDAGRVTLDFDKLVSTDPVPDFGDLGGGGGVEPTIGRRADGKVTVTSVYDELPAMQPVAENEGVRESFLAREARQGIINKVMRETGKSRGEVTEALLDAQGVLNDRPLLQFLLNGAINVLIALIKSKLGL